MKEYMLLIRNEVEHTSALSEEQHQAFLNKCMLYIDSLKREGKLKAAQPLLSEGVIISRSQGVWQDLLFNETKEVIVGYYHILADNLQEAVEIAQRNPEFEYRTTARIEVRPIKMKEQSTGYTYPNE